ncbi:hypothetical protein WBP07_20350 (plasmid) [Novosphingobium sp. BL-8A]|uniref:hypothetical protein n=1 Tax=Novosphingobium sp. BL-8A TaxID=3127639 RepID=UPI003757D2F2
MAIIRHRNAIAILAAVSLIAAAPPAPQSGKRLARGFAGQSSESTGTAAVGAGTGGEAAAAGAVAGSSIFEGTWIWALAGLIAAGGLTAAALSGDGDPPVSPAS